MYEVIDITTKAQVGIFSTCADAEKWILAHGGHDLFRIFPW